MQQRPQPIPICKTDKNIFWCLVALALLAAVGGILHVVCMWPSIPDTVGYHFGANGQFDLFGPKESAFWHPFISQFLLILLFSAAGWLCYYVRPLRRVLPAMHRLTVISTAHWCNLAALCCSGFFTYWEYCVVTQTPLLPTVPQSIVVVMAASFVVVSIIAIIAIAKREKKQTDQQD